MGHYSKAHASRLGTAQVLNYSGNTSAITSNAFSALLCKLRVFSEVQGWMQIASAARLRDLHLVLDENTAAMSRSISLSPLGNFARYSSSTATGVNCVVEKAYNARDFPLAKPLGAIQTFPSRYRQRAISFLHGLTTDVEVPS